MFIIIEIKNLKKTFNGRDVLNIESLTFHSGRRYVLLGENGSGKSTLLRILAGITEQDDGIILWNGGSFTPSVAYVPQKPYAFRMPVWKSVILGCDSTLDRNKRRMLSESLLAEMGLSHLANQTEAKLSGGEGQRVAFARAIKLKRDILLLDEPTSAMDREGTHLAERRLNKYVEENEPILILATHSAKQAARLGEEAVLMRGGKVVAEGAVQAVLAERNRQAEMFD